MTVLRHSDRRLDNVVGARGRGWPLVSGMSLLLWVLNVLSRLSKLKVAHGLVSIVITVRVRTSSGIARRRGRDIEGRELRRIV